VSRRVVRLISMTNKIIAFTGLAMTGKSTARMIMQQLLDEKGIANEYVHFGSTEEVARRDTANEWTNEEAILTQQQKERLIRERWRAEYGMGVMAEKMLPRIKELLHQDKLIVIDNLYSDEERDILKTAFGDDSLIVVALSADWLVRVRRAKNRPERPLRMDELRERDKAEVYNLQKGATIALADFTIVSNTDEQTDPERARAVIHDALQERVLPIFLI
jgi:dephospho-CoA kinase